MIIYPPYIADTIPAFINSEIKIPFFMNPAIKKSQIKSARLKIQRYNSSEDDIWVLSCEGLSSISFSQDEKSGVVIFHNEEPERLIQNSYYQFQLSFVDDDTDFQAYSTISIGKCLGDESNAPVIKLKGRQNQTLSTTSINVGSTSFTSLVSTPINEPVYNYRFIIKNMETNQIVDDTDWLLNNVETDEFASDGQTRGTSHNYTLNQELEQWTKHSITYAIKTINGYEKDITCSIIRQKELPIQFKGYLSATQDGQAKENGYVLISLTGQPIRGKFELQRTSDGKVWHTLTAFETTKLSNLSDYNWKDWSVEQGVSYTYAIRQVAREQYSERLEAKPILIEFDHMFLSDGTRQLKIAYNPKVSSIKDTILESKMDTIGSKYPFFFRNETVRYKELPISGLLSYISDDNELFITNEELNVNTRIANIESSTFGAERRFKMTVLDWLNNGEPKLFRSPGEGNYIVRIMNTSLSPNEQLGRMIHTFSSTAYEIMDNSLNNLQKYNLINFPSIKDLEAKFKMVTFTFDQLSYNSDNIATVVINNTLFTGEKIQPNSISNINWTAIVPQKEDYIELTPVLENNTKNQTIQYYNNLLGQLNIQAGINYSTLAVKKPTINENYGSSITFSYIPDTTEELGTDEFEYMVATSNDTLFTVPVYQKLYESVSYIQDGQTIVNTGALLKQSTENEYETIYRTYGLIVRKGEVSESIENDSGIYDFVFKNREGQILNTIDCSDGQIRYFMDIDDDVIYEKGIGLTVDIYACIGGMREFNSSLLGQFLLGYSILGGN